MGNTVEDTIGRQLEVSMDFAEKRIFVNSHKPDRPSSAVAVFTPKQALKMAAILTHAVRHTLGWHDEEDVSGLPFGASTARNA